MSINGTGSRHGEPVVVERVIADLGAEAQSDRYHRISAGVGLASRPRQPDIARKPRVCVCVDHDGCTLRALCLPVPSPTILIREQYIMTC